MMRMLALVALLASARPASACGVPDVGALLGDLVKIFEPDREPVHVPIAVVGGGASTEGSTLALAAGYGWGERERGGLFPGTVISRVLVGVRRADVTAVSLTFGWYQNAIGAGAFDFGIEHDLGDGATGPVARLALGYEGIAVRLGGAFLFGGDEPRAVGQVELVVEVLDLVDAI